MSTVITIILVEMHRSRTQNRATSSRALSLQRRRHSQPLQSTTSKAGIRSTHQLPQQTTQDTRSTGCWVSIQWRVMAQVPHGSQIRPRMRVCTFLREVGTAWSMDPSMPFTTTNLVRAATASGSVPVS
ncbi:MAG: hypothetical protein EBV35_09170 [Betaproteobacteria bacterium]|nr:hypothetical protein [Betaproteobacteria bacterium]